MQPLSIFIKRRHVTGHSDEGQLFLFGFLSRLSFFHAYAMPVCHVTSTTLFWLDMFYVDEYFKMTTSKNDSAF